jgi:hypothetical protein
MACAVWALENVEEFQNRNAFEVVLGRRAVVISGQRESFGVAPGGGGKMRPKLVL